MIVKLTQDKVVKHSVRYALEHGTISMSVYIPKELVLRMQIETPEQNNSLNGFPKDVWLNMSIKEIK